MGFVWLQFYTISRKWCFSPFCFKDLLILRGKPVERRGNLPRRLARMEGAWRAQAEVVVFLDSHIEALRAFGPVGSAGDGSTESGVGERKSREESSCRDCERNSVLGDFYSCIMKLMTCWMLDAKCRSSKFFDLLQTSLKSWWPSLYMVQGLTVVFPSTPTCKMAKTSVGFRFYRCEFFSESNWSIGDITGWARDHQWERWWKRFQWGYAKSWGWGIWLAWEIDLSWFLIE